LSTPDFLSLVILANEGSPGREELREHEFIDLLSFPRMKYSNSAP